MIQIRPSAERGHADHGWLNTYYTFSFADYYDREHMQFRSLRVINEDRIQAGQGFRTHPHRDMEILTYILEGSLEHKDSMGTGSVIQPGELQRMTAGSGVLHSEFNPSDSDPVHLLQIWILPEKQGLQPSYEQRPADTGLDGHSSLRLIASPNGADGSVTVHQDVSLYRAALVSGEALTYELPEGRFAWVQVTKGSLALNGNPLAQGDGAAAVGEPRLIMLAGEDAEALVFNLV